MVEEHHQVDHSCEFVGADGAHTNHAESLFARIRQAHAGAWHRLGVQWLANYAAEMAWRQEMVGQGNLDQLKDLLGRLLKTRPTGRLKDYWRKSEAGKALPAEDADGIIQRVPAAAVPRKRGRPKKS